MPLLPAPAIPIANPLYCLGNHPEPSESATPKLAPANAQQNAHGQHVVESVNEEKAVQQSDHDG